MGANQADVTAADHTLNRNASYLWLKLKPEESIRSWKRSTFLPFNRSQTADFQPAIKELMARARSEVQAILDQESSADFHNTVEPLEALWHPLNRATSMLFNLHSAETSDELEKVVEQIAPEIVLFLQRSLAESRIVQQSTKSLGKSSKRTARTSGTSAAGKTYRSFCRNGALLTDEEKDKLRSIDEQLSIESIQFGQVVLKDTNDFFLHLSDQQLDGLPTSALENAKEEAHAPAVWKMVESSRCRRRVMVLQ